MLTAIIKQLDTKHIQYYKNSLNSYKYFVRRGSLTKNLRQIKRNETVLLITQNAHTLFFFFQFVIFTNFIT